MRDAPLYSSEPTARSLWQAYRIYDDRVEFETLLGTLVVPFAHVERVEVSESDLTKALRGDFGLQGFRAALKLDWANFVEHLVLDKSAGRIRRILFTPEDPARFRDVLRGAVERYRQRRAGAPT